MRAKLTYLVILAAIVIAGVLTAGSAVACGSSGC